jgi:hypothetical protein
VAAVHVNSRWTNGQQSKKYVKNIKTTRIHCKKPKYFYKNQGGGENCGGLIFELCSVAITMNLGTSSHGNGVILPENPPCFCGHFVD